MGRFEELAEQLEELLPVDVVDRDVILPNGAILKVARARKRGVYCATCQHDLALVGHHNNCPVFQVERHAAKGVGK